jgi:hypothetical protein
VTSLLFVIGKAKEGAFRSDILAMYEVPRLRYDPRLINVFAWALTRLNDKRGFDLANEILSGPEPEYHVSFIHFFSQHDPEARYDIIKHFVTRNAGDFEAMRRLGDILKNSAYDFHEELQYLNVYSQSVPAAMRLSATAV